jgi:hypothetical protein
VVHERLSKVKALAVLSADAISSVAYGPEAALMVLTAAGANALWLNLPISAAIALLLVIRIVSYRQTIFAYPSGGGAADRARAHRRGVDHLGCCIDLGRAGARRQCTTALSGARKPWCEHAADMAGTRIRRKHPAKLHADKGNDFSEKPRALRRRGVTPGIARRGCGVERTPGSLPLGG